MNIIDIIILCCLRPSPYPRPFRKGFVSQAFSLVAMILGVWLSFKFSNAVGEWLVTYIDLPSTVIHVIAFALIMLVIDA